MDRKSNQRINEPNVYYLLINSYYKTAKNYITMLQKHESAPLVVREINDGYEGEEFFSLWREELNKNKQAIFSDIVQDWNVWYKEV